MKASLKFRDQQKPLIRAKVPLSILGFPFQSGVAAGESKELSLQLSTFFVSGPTLKIAYKPNDSWHPFTLVLKTGTGPYGSPNSSSLVMSAEFNLVGGGNRGSPSFFLHFKPRFGDFSLKKKQSSGLSTNLLNSPTNGAVLDNGDANGHVHSPVIDMREYYFGGKSNLSALPSVLGHGLFSGVQVSARTSLPVRERAVVRCRWGVRLPESLVGSEQECGKKRFHKVPLLVMEKISIEQVDRGDREATNKHKNNKWGSEAGGAEGVGELLYGVRRQLDILQGENGLLRKAVEELKWEMGGGAKKSDAPSYHHQPGPGEIGRGRSGTSASVLERQGERKPHGLSSVKGGVPVAVAGRDATEESKK